MRKIIITNAENSIILSYKGYKSSIHFINDIDKFRTIYNIIPPNTEVVVNNPDLMTYTAILAAYKNKKGVIINKLISNGENLNYAISLFSLADKAKDDTEELLKNIRYVTGKEVLIN